MDQPVQQVPERGTVVSTDLTRRRVLRVYTESERGDSVIRALASEPRRRILDLLSDRNFNVSEIAEALDMPSSTATLHVSTLEESGLLKTELQPGLRGLQKICSRAYDIILIELPHEAIQQDGQALEIAMPVGAFVDCEVAAPCGLAQESGIIGHFDDPASFYEPTRLDAQLLWFRHGYVEYRFPNRLSPAATLDSLSLTVEICSEAPLHHGEWLSDITMWINGVEVATWTSPADFGGEDNRGLLNPQWWENHNSQHGLLKRWEVTHQGSFVDGVEGSTIRLADLDLMGRPYISVRIGNRPDAVHAGGLNLFGRHFGNYPQDLLLRLRYH